METIAKPYQTVGTSGREQLAETELATVLDSTEPPRAEFVYRNPDTQSVSLRESETTAFEQTGSAPDEVWSCREYGFHSQQDVAEYFDAWEMNTWSVREAFDAEL